MAWPPETQGHELGPEVGAERFAALQRIARLAVPEGAGGGVGVGERGRKHCVLGGPSVEISQRRANLDGDLSVGETAVGEFHDSTGEGWVVGA